MLILMSVVFNKNACRPLRRILLVITRVNYAVLSLSYVTAIATFTVTSMLFLSNSATA
jgi:membrane glycosyltransferase